MIDGQIEGYLIALQGATWHALERTITRITRGEIPDLSKRYCPSAPELSAAIRDEMAYVERQIALAAERMAIADKRPQAVARLTMEERIAAARQRMQDEGRALVFHTASHAEFLSRRREMPPKGCYIGITGEVYGAPGSANAQPEPVSVDW